MKPDNQYWWYCIDCCVKRNFKTPVKRHRSAKLHENKKHPTGVYNRTSWYGNKMGTLNY